MVLGAEHLQQGEGAKTAVLGDSKVGRALQLVLRAQHLQQGEQGNPVQPCQQAEQQQAEQRMRAWCSVRNTCKGAGEQRQLCWETATSGIH